MCYTAKCSWEDYMGECMYPYYIIKVRDKYDKIKCNATNQEYSMIFEEENKVIRIEQRKKKITTLKTKLLNK